MITPDQIYPDHARPASLATDLCAWFATLPYVCRVVQFGSLVRGSADRWSDLDMVVVTAGRADSLNLLSELNAYKPYWYYAPVRKSEKHPGTNALGITFLDESPFNCLDLNFISLADYAAPHAIAWLGPVRECFVASTNRVTVVDDDEYKLDELDEREMAIDGACFWTRRSAQGLLRGKSNLDLLKRRLSELELALHGMPEDCAMAGGNICRIGRIWLEIAATLLHSP